MNATVDEIGRVVHGEGVDCDFAHEGSSSLARTPAQLARVGGPRAAAARSGSPTSGRILGRDEAAKLVNAAESSAARSPSTAPLLHPGKLVRGLASVVERLGATIYEGTPVEPSVPGS